jgi:hypothetical protein
MLKIEKESNIIRNFKIQNKNKIDIGKKFIYILYIYKILSYLIYIELLLL